MNLMNDTVRAHERGFTLIEMMVALAIGTFLTLGAFSVLYSSQQTQSINEQTAQTQQNARIAMELIASDLKDAGFNAQTLAPPGIGNCGVNGILPGDNNPLGADTGPDSVSMILPVSLSTLATQINSTPATALVDLQAGSVAMAVADGFATSAPYVTPLISIAGYYTGTVSAYAVDRLTLSSNVTLPKGAFMPVGTSVYWLKCVMYRIIHAGSNAATEQPLCGGSLPCLVRGTPPCNNTQPGPPCVPVVDGIEDLQIAYACDGCTGVEDGVIDDQVGGTANQFDAVDFVSNSAWNTGAFLPKTIRTAQVTVVARQVRTRMKGEDVSKATAILTPAPLVVQDHNHAAGVFVAGDLGSQTALSVYAQTQHRVLTRIVQLKNMGLF
jgi:type IV pilus assembly protein PilW